MWRDKLSIYTHVQRLYEITLDQYLLIKRPSTNKLICMIDMLLFQWAVLMFWGVCSGITTAQKFIRFSNELP